MRVVLFLLVFVGQVQAAGNWVDDMVAVYNLDEPGSTTRVNAQGTTSRDLTVGVGVPDRDLTNKVQGIASFLANGSSEMRGGGTAIAAPSAPFTAGCWARSTATGSGSDTFMMGAWGFPDGGWRLDWNDVSKRYTMSVCKPSAVCTKPTMPGPNSDNTIWTHVVGQLDANAQTVRQFISGVAQGTAANGGAGAYVPFDDWFRIGGNAGTQSFVGNLDECFVYQGALTAPEVCRICACGMDGSLCTCSGTAYTTEGRRPSCGNCPLTVACDAAAPPSASAATTTTIATTTSSTGGTTSSTTSTTTSTVTSTTGVGSAPVDWTLDSETVAWWPLDSDTLNHSTSTGYCSPPSNGDLHLANCSSDMSFSATRVQGSGSIAFAAGMGQLAQNTGLTGSADCLRSAQPNQFTVTSWFRVTPAGIITANPFWVQFITNETQVGGPQTQNKGWMMMFRPYDATGNAAFCVGIGATECGAMAFVSSALPADSQWHFIVGGYDGAVGFLGTLGKLKTQVTAPVTLVKNDGNGGLFEMPHQPGDCGMGYPNQTGNQDAVWFTGRVLTDQQACRVRSIHPTGELGWCTGTGTGWNPCDTDTDCGGRVGSCNLLFPSNKAGTCVGLLGKNYVAGETMPATCDGVPTVAADLGPCNALVASTPGTTTTSSSAAPTTSSTATTTTVVTTTSSTSTTLAGIRVFYIDKDGRGPTNVAGSVTCSDGFTAAQGQNQATPFCTIGRGADVANTPGDTVDVRASTVPYGTAHNCGTCNFKSVVEPKFKGTAASPITFRAHVGEQPVIDPNGATGSTLLYGFFIQQEGQTSDVCWGGSNNGTACTSNATCTGGGSCDHAGWYLVIDGFKFTDWDYVWPDGQGPAQIGSQYAIEAPQSAQPHAMVTVRNCEFTDNEGGGTMRVRGSFGWTVENNSFHDNWTHGWTTVVNIIDSTGKRQAQPNIIRRNKIWNNRDTCPQWCRTKYCTDPDGNANPADDNECNLTTVGGGYFCPCKVGSDCESGICTINTNQDACDGDNPDGSDESDTEGNGIIIDRAKGLCVNDQRVECLWSTDPTCSALGGCRMGDDGNVIIENNLVWDNWGYGINCFLAGDCVIRNNVVWHNGRRNRSDTAAEIATWGRNTVISNNISVPRAEGSCTCANDAQCGGVTGSCDLSLIWSDTCRNGPKSTCTTNADCASGVCRMKVAFSPIYGGGFSPTAQATNQMYSGNLTWNGAAGQNTVLRAQTPGVGFYTVTSFKAIADAVAQGWAGNGASKNFLFVDPALVSPTTGANSNFQPIVGSPVLAAGDGRTTSWGAGLRSLTDYLGITRSATVPSIGAYELASGAATTTSTSITGTTSTLGTTTTTILGPGTFRGSAVSGGRM